VYFALCLAGALAVIAGLSAVLAHGARVRELHWLHSMQLLRGLDAYSASVLAQRSSALWDAEAADQALRSARSVAQAWFPQLESEFAALNTVHERLRELPGTRHPSRLDPEAWLDTPEDRFALLWSDHLDALAAIRRHLAAAAFIENPQPAKGWG